MAVGPQVVEELSQRAPAAPSESLQRAHPPSSWSLAAGRSATQSEVLAVALAVCLFVAGAAIAILLALII
jgi:hypothetical protein